MARLAVILLLAFCLGAPPAAAAREAGWVPIPAQPWKPSFKPPERGKAKKPAAAPRLEEATVYDKQNPIKEPELANFIALLPQFRSWTRREKEEAHPVVNAQGRPDFAYSPKAAQWVSARGFAPSRFFCIMGKMAASLAIIEEGNDLQSSRPRDMPQVDEAEVALARRHRGELLAAGGGAAPIN